MPYITKDNRIKFDEGINSIIDALHFGIIDDRRDVQAGELNFVISSIIWDIFRKHPSYTTANSIMGVLSSVQAEFYRRQVVPYEEEKIKENGDIC